MNTIQVVGAISAVINIVKAIEQALPEGGKGREKLALALEVLELTGVVTKEMLPTIESLIGAVVRFLNATGVFKQSAA